ncbi:hypothetical protein DSCA_23130 [Desulfosarcina alkanivorans]|uniref:Outer membrane protein beta-barrel domain-containing protein n=1 Tax=Desulfosarcina alkanivorans TaxID=571177 RepID=A0A5K7YIM2_9BACT|nr:transporter [Desulfosarcina alkanivorans]BBO68383.1 hypothetical protein DSCA_23130 [Desulfosarcina alkanivorans]
MLKLLCPYCALGADNQLVTSVAASYEYNDNIRLDDRGELADSIYTIAPRLALVREGERLSARADAMAEFYRYGDYDDFDDTDQWYNAEASYQATERWQLGLEGHLSDDNRPDRDIETTGVVLGNIRRKRSNAGASAAYVFSEMTSGGLFVEFNRENYDDDQTSDRRDYHAVLYLNRSLEGGLARTTGRLNLGYSHYEFERDYTLTGTDGFFDITTAISDDSEVDSYSLTAGTETALTERLDLTVDLGGRYARSESDQGVARTYDPPLIVQSPVTSSDSYDSWGFVGSLTAEYRGERSSCALFFSHDLQPVSGQNSTANRTTVRLSGQMRLLERLRANLAVQWYRNESDQDDPTQDDVDTQTWNLRGGLTWSLTDDFDLTADYVYTVYEDRDGDTTACRNKFLLQLTAAHDWLE